MRIGIDLGGTNIAGGLVTDDGKLIFKTSIPTVCDKGELGLMEEILKVVNMLLANEAADNITSIGIGVPGHVDEKTGLVVICNNVPFENTHLADFITKNTGIPCYLGNDACRVIVKEDNIANLRSIFPCGNIFALLVPQACHCVCTRADRIFIGIRACIFKAE